MTRYSLSLKHEYPKKTYTLLKSKKRLQIEALFTYFAYSTARVSRMTVTLICPG